MDDESESSMMRYPESYEDGDRAIACFEHDDPALRTVALRVKNSEWNYGRLIAANEKGDCSLICNYPRLRGMVYVHRDRLPAATESLRGANLRFRIRKTGNGHIQAFDCEIAQKEQAYLCSQPSFGKLTPRKSNVITGFVEKIINRDDHWFGFVLAGRKSYYFSGRKFLDVYERKAIESDIVHFTTSEQKDGRIQIRSFFTTPEGENGACWSMQCQIEPKMRPGGGEKSAPWKNTTLICPSKTFADFVEPRPEGIYYAYSADEHNAAETHELRFSRISDVISFACNKTIPDRLKLEAIDKLIAVNLQRPERCRPETLRQWKRRILDDQTRWLLDKGQTEAALQSAVELMAIDYQPARLKSFRGLPQVFNLGLPEPLQPLAAIDTEKQSEEGWRLLAETVAVDTADTATGPDCNLAIPAPLQSDWLPDNGEWNLKVDVEDQTPYIAEYLRFNIEVREKQHDIV